MCIVKSPKVPTMPERQAVQTPMDPTDLMNGFNARRRRGLWASIMTGPQGVVGGPPKVTGTGSGVLGG
jgi:hypothetical protein